MAVRNGHTDCVVALLRRGAGAGRSPGAAFGLAISAASSGNVSMCMAFLDHGNVDPLSLLAPVCASTSLPLLVDVLGRCPDLGSEGASALLRAILAGNVEAVHMLLDRGVDPNTCSRDVRAGCAALVPVGTQ
jgi:ankyrin repeat protein